MSHLALYTCAKEQIVLFQICPIKNSNNNNFEVIDHIACDKKHITSESIALV